ncbi:MAG: hypothetical protein ACKV2Q_25545 [Planctomycetaceae bacterium]
MSRALPCVCVLILNLCISVAIGEERDLKLVPNADLQKAISVALSSGDNFALSPALKSVLDLTEGKPERLVPELLFYVTQFEPGDSGERLKRKAAFLLMVNRLDISEHPVMVALVPYLDSSDKVVRETVGKLLTVYEDTSHNRPPDFANFGGLLESSFRQTGEPPTGLVRHMYEAHPPAALDELLPHLRLPEDRKDVRVIRLAEHTVADVLWRLEHNFMDEAQVRAAASEHLRILASSKHWWVRCYPAYIMKAYPVLRIEEIVQLLKKDTHKAVSGAVQFTELP